MTLIKERQKSLTIGFKSENLFSILEDIRKKNSKQEFSSLRDTAIKKFLEFDINLQLAVLEAKNAFVQIIEKNPEFLQKIESELVLELRQGLLNFYSDDAVTPFIPLSAKGPWIVTLKGGVIYDAGGYGMLGFGHNPDFIKKVLEKDFAMANVMTTSVSQRSVINLLKSKIGNNKCPYYSFAFMNSGSEAVEVATRISDANAKTLTDFGAIHYGKKIKYLALKNSFHGRTYRAALASGSKIETYKQLASFRDSERLVVIEPNNLNELLKTFQNAEKENVFFEMMFLEPVMGEGNAGYAISPEFYALARQLTKEQGTLLLVDSIQAGLRCQGVLSICDYQGFENLEAPDFETFSKAISGGQYPISVLALTEKSNSLYKAGLYGNTMTGNPRGLNIISEVLENSNTELKNNIISKGRELRASLEMLQIDFPDLIEEVRGKGLLISIKLNNKFPVSAKNGIEKQLRQKGLNVIHSGGNRLRFTPWFLINQKEIDLIVETLKLEFKKYKFDDLKIEEKQDMKLLQTKNTKNFLSSISPIDNAILDTVSISTDEDYEEIINLQSKAFLEWRNIPAPKRGLIIKEIGQEIAKVKDELGKLVSLETGKILEEGKGEVQEIIDLIDYAVGLSRQLNGNTMQSERPLHKMFEQWQPLGIVGVITAFNFPVAVWGWNAMLAAICGNVVLWKPSELAPLSAIAINNIAKKVTEKNGFKNIFEIIIGDSPHFGKKIAADKKIALVSATGSTEMGRSVGESVAKRLGKVILELGGNNAVIVMEDADLDLAVPAIVFGAVGTAGQRCTTTRRVIVHKDLKQELTNRLVNAYKQIKIGNPLDSKTLVGPLINKKAVQNFLEGIEIIKSQGGKILYGGELAKGQTSDLYVVPTLVDAKREMQIINKEIFAPILYILECENIDSAIEINNNVPQGLSSAIFTKNVQYSEKFISASGSDCGIANINLGTSGAEIGGAFGGEKETGGGRESGSDSWKAYMRRQTTTLNFSNKLPLAQGIKFEV